MFLNKLVSSSIRHKFLNKRPKSSLVGSLKYQFSLAMGNNLGKDSKSYTTHPESIPSDAWVVTVYLESVNGIVQSLSHELYSDPYVVFRLSSKSSFGPQQQHSSYHSYSMNPRWLPPEKFEFLVSSSDVLSKRGAILLIEVMDWDTTKADDALGNASFRLSELAVIKQSMDESYVDEGESHRLQLLHPETNESIPGCFIAMRIAAGPRDAVLGNLNDVIVEHVRWNTSTGWDASVRRSSDPKQFTYECDPVKGSDQQLFGNDFTVLSASIDSNRKERSGLAAATDRWTVSGDGGDVHGWQYASSFESAEWAKVASSFNTCRRRYWRRKTRLHADGSLQGKLPRRAGWLAMIRGSVVTPHYFVLWPQALLYYDHEPPSFYISEHRPAGVVRLAGTSMTCHAEDVIEITSAELSKSYLLQCREDDREGAAAILSGWFNSIRTIDAPVDDERVGVDRRMIVYDDHDIFDLLAAHEKSTCTVKATASFPFDEAEDVDFECFRRASPEKPRAPQREVEPDDADWPCFEIFGPTPSAGVDRVDPSVPIGLKLAEAAELTTCEVHDDSVYRITNVDSGVSFDLRTGKIWGSE